MSGSGSRHIYLGKGQLAPSNAALVEKAARIIEVLGDQVATPADARQMLAFTDGLPTAGKLPPHDAHAARRAEPRPPSAPSA